MSNKNPLIFFDYPDPKGSEENQLTDFRSYFSLLFDIQLLK